MFPAPRAIDQQLTRFCREIQWGHEVVSYLIWPMSETWRTIWKGAIVILATLSHGPETHIAMVDWINDGCNYCTWVSGVLLTSPVVSLQNLLPSRYSLFKEASNQWIVSPVDNCCFLVAFFPKTRAHESIYTPVLSEAFPVNTIITTVGFEILALRLVLWKMNESQQHPTQYGLLSQTATRYCYRAWPYPGLCLTSKFAC